MKNLVSALQSMRTSALINKKPPPYIYDQYNVFPFYSSQSSNVRKILVRLQHAFTEAFNRRIKLPKYIIILPDKDFIMAADFFEFGVKKLLCGLTMWLARELERMLDIRMNDLFEQRPGSVYHHETQVIWVRMTQRPPAPPSNERFKIQAVKSKMDTAIDELIEARKNTHAINIDHLQPLAHFDQQGRLNHDGLLAFWKELDFQFKRFDRKEIDLKDLIGPKSK